MYYRIVICSYKRADLIQEKTLKYLEECNINPKLIDIWVANDEEKEEYINKIPKEKYGNIYVGTLGYHNVKNDIEMFYPKGMNLVHFDDDVEYLSVLKKHKKGKDELVEFYKFEELVKLGFGLLRKYKADLLGFAPVHNHFYMSNTLGIGLYFCIGNCYLHIVSKDIKLQYADYTDFELCLKTYLKNGKVLRLNNICASTNYASTDGGTKEYRSFKLQKKISEEMLRLYPKYIQYNKKPDKPYQVKFIRQKENVRIKLEDL